MIYEIIEQEYGQILKATDTDGNVYWIPMDESNSDYQRYLNSEVKAKNVTK